MSKQNPTPEEIARSKANRIVALKRVGVAVVIVLILGVIVNL